MAPKIGDLLSVTRDDIQDFPGDTIDLIMQIQKDGWRAQRSNRNHVMLLAPDGETRLAASRNANSAKYLAEDLRRYNKTKDIVATEEESVEVKTVVEKHACPHTYCPRVFNSPENLSVHIGVEHESLIVCPEDGCYELFKDNRAVGRHRGIKHGYKSPRYEARKKKEAERKAKEEETDQSFAGFGAKTSEYIPTVQQLDSEEVAELQNIEDPEERLRKADEIAAKWVSEDEAEEEETSEDTNQDSWVLDMSMIMELSVETVLKNMYAAGLGMEIRVWKEEK